MERTWHQVDLGVRSTHRGMDTPGNRRSNGAMPIRACDRRAMEYPRQNAGDPARSEEHTSELQSLMRISYAVFCLKKKKKKTRSSTITHGYEQNRIKYRYSLQKPH